MTIGKLMKRCGDYPYLAFRVIVGLLFMLHGAQKYGLMGDSKVRRPVPSAAGACLCRGHH